MDLGKVEKIIRNFTLVVFSMVLKYRFKKNIEKRSGSLHSTLFLQFKITYNLKTTSFLLLLLLIFYEQSNLYIQL